MNDFILDSQNKEDNQKLEKILQFIKLILNSKKCAVFGFMYTLTLSANEMEDNLKFIDSIPKGLWEMFNLQLTRDQLETGEKDELICNSGRFVISPNTDLYEHINEILDGATDDSLEIIHKLVTNIRRSRLTLIKPN